MFLGFIANVSTKNLSGTPAIVVSVWLSFLRMAFKFCTNNSHAKTADIEPLGFKLLRLVRRHFF